MVAERKVILLPTDGSATAQAAARFAEDIAKAEGSLVLVLGVVERAMIDHIEDEAVTAALRDFIAEQVSAEVERVRAAGADAEEVVIEAASPHEGILRVAAERHVDLIVMGTHGRSALARAVIGSVADRVVRHADIPVVLVPLRMGD